MIEPARLPGPNSGLITGLLVGGGALIGTAFGAYTANWGLWIPLGVGIGVFMAFAMHMSRSIGKKE